jgi:hypothetical protein
MLLPSAEMPSVVRAAVPSLSKTCVTASPLALAT